MIETISRMPHPVKLGSIRRKSVSLSEDSLIAVKELQPGSLLPLLVQPAIHGVNLISWAQSHRAFIKSKLLEHGGILFRNWKVKSADEFEQFAKATFGKDLLEYRYGSTPRTRVSGQIYTSTEYPADQFIPQHNEMAYTRTWPMKLYFYCAQPAQKGGETPISDSRSIFDHIDPKIREKFIQKQVLYVRNYGRGLDVPWENVFQTADRSEVESFCRNENIEFEWKGSDGLRTRQICQAVAEHPETGERVWFNQAHLFHVSNLRAAVRDKFLKEFEEEDLPRNTYYGDGSPIEIESLDEIRRIYEQESIAFPWRAGDVLVLDNMLAAHGRMPFEGPRKTLVAMAEPNTATLSG